VQRDILISLLMISVSFLIAFTIYFPFRKLADKAGFYAIPNVRSSHRNHIPNIGGLIFYLSLIMTMIFYWRNIQLNHIAVLTSLSVLSFMVVGLIDDKGSKSAWQKLIFQATGIGLFIAGNQLIFSDFLGIMKLAFPYNISFTFFFFLIMINSMNLIDGIDGLAASIGLTIYLSLGFFFLNHNIQYLSLFSFSISGIIIAFLYFNFSKKYKMIMGDTGSLFLGFTISVIIIKAYYIINTVHSTYTFASVSSYSVFGLAIIPVFDLARVFIIRIMQRKSPFRGDRNHIHHVLLDKLKMSHKQATIVIVCINLLFFFVVYVAGWFLNGFFMLMMYGFLFLFYNGFLYSIISERIFTGKRIKLSNLPGDKGV
jgi:UDP-GlcNAc:undecaprenyl-phosphate GlcNAc-1-phosphate transferase